MAVSERVAACAADREKLPNGVQGWLGIPYATAERFRAPRVLTPWVEGPAVTYGPSPLQGDVGWTGERTPAAEGRELNLCVYRPARSTDSVLPVVVWIFGGGFENGANSVPEICGADLATSADAVVVAPNHRLGAFGFCSLDGFGGRLADASNLGVQDVIAALQWVRDNISTFGGDPGRVTVVGQSSGAFISTALLAADSARGLFNQLIAISGPASRVSPLDSSRAIGRALVDLLGLSDEPARIAELPAGRVLESQGRVLATDIGIRNARVPQAFAITEDSTAPRGILRGHPASVIEEGGAAGISMMLCATLDEVSEFRAADRSHFDPDSVDSVADELKTWGLSDEESHSIVAHYAANGLTAGDVREHLLTDWIYRLPTARTALSVAEHGGTSYLGIFGRAGGEPAGHSSIVPALLARPEEMTAPDERGERARAFAAAVRAFVHGRDPWSPLDGSMDSARLFGASATPIEQDLTEMLAAWRGVARP